MTKDKQSERLTKTLVLLFEFVVQVSSPKWLQSFGGSQIIMVNLLINFNFVTYLWLWSLDPLIVFNDTMVSVALVSGLELNKVEPW